LVGAAVLVLALLGGSALVTARAQRESRQQLEQRLVLRNTLAASFAASYVRTIVKSEQQRARASLTGRRVTERQFQDVVSSLSFGAALLVDSGGRVLHVWPRELAIIGSQIGSRYAHLSKALRGEVAISNVVSSAARGTPIVAFAIPLATPAGRRVFSGAFAVGRTPLADYLSTAMPFSEAELMLMDDRGALVIHNRPGAMGIEELTTADPLLAEAIGGRSRGYYSRGGESRFFARHAVAGTPWQLLASVPEKQLLAPLNGITSYIPWFLLAAFALAAATAAFLVFHLAQHRARLAASNRRLAETNEELRDLDRLKDEFVALVSHELRTPLTSIIGYVSALQRGRAGVVPTAQRDLLSIVERNAHRLVSLVSDLLLAAKADAGKLRLEPELFELAPLVAQAVESARPRAEEQQVRLELSLSVTGLVYADRARLAQVFDNLLSNAIKFSPTGSTVHVLTSSHESEAAIEIRDEGIGIPPAEQGQLFQRFFRASTATSREIQGTGLGLSIVKTIVDLHGGSVQVKSREGAGTTFRVTLPHASAQEIAA